MGRKGTTSIWRVPNFALEPRGDYFHEPDELIDRLNKLRSVAGGIIVLGMIVCYSGLSHTGYTKKGGLLGGADITLGTPEGSWLVQIIATISVAILVIPLVSLILIFSAERGYRRLTFYQLRWIVMTAAVYAAFCAAIFPLVKGISYLQQSLMRHHNLIIEVAVFLVSAAVGTILLAWFFKGMYLIATGLFRADDAHPLLAPIAAIPIAWIVSLFLYLNGGTGGLTGVPETLGKSVAFGGAASVTVISVLTLRRLKKHPHWAFRRGPARLSAPVSGARGAGSSSSPSP